MKNIIFSLVLFAFLFSGHAHSQDSAETKPSVKEILCTKWMLSEYTENGVKTDSPVIYIMFKNSGQYIYKEESDFTNENSDTDIGVWILTDKNEIVFDKGTDDEEIWNIVSIDASKLVVKYTEDNTIVQGVFIPKK
ncbi:MAG: hypothetical protein PHN88_09330 [Ignavibacteria bacterium]|nr:hypothetical protein [Ignavibacteria bacterium]